MLKDVIVQPHKVIPAEVKVLQPSQKFQHIFIQRMESIISEMQLLQIHVRRKRSLQSWSYVTLRYIEFGHFGRKCKGTVGQNVDTCHCVVVTDTAPHTSQNRGDNPQIEQTPDQPYRNHCESIKMKSSRKKYQINLLQPLLTSSY